MAWEVHIRKVVLLDNVDIIAGDEDLELGLFGFFNRWYDKGKRKLKYQRFLDKLNKQLTDKLTKL